MRANKSLQKTSIKDAFGLNASRFDLLVSPGRQMLLSGKEELGENLVKNGKFNDFTFDDGRNTPKLLVESDDEIINVEDDRTFEGGTGNWVNGYNSAAIGSSPDFAHSGTNSLKITSGTTQYSTYITNSSWGMESLLFPRTYELKYWTYIPSSSNCTSVQVFIGNLNGRNDLINNPISIKDQWVQGVHRFTTSELDTAWTISAYVNGVQGSIAYIDDISLKQVGVVGNWIFNDKYAFDKSNLLGNKYAAYFNDTSLTTTPISVGTVHTINFKFSLNSYSTEYSTLMYGDAAGSNYFFNISKSGNIYYRDGSSHVYTPWTPKFKQNYNGTVIRNGQAVSFYIDGVKIGSTLTLTTNEAVNITNLGKAGTNFLDGYISDIKVYTRTVSDIEIAKLNKGLVLSEGLEAHWTFNNPDTWLQDKTANGYTLTNNGVELHHGRANTVLQDWSNGGAIMKLEKLQNKDLNDSSNLQTYHCVNTIVSEDGYNAVKVTCDEGQTSIVSAIYLKYDDNSEILENGQMYTVSVWYKKGTFNELPGTVRVCRSNGIDLQLNYLSHTKTKDGWYKYEGSFTANGVTDIQTLRHYITSDGSGETFFWRSPSISKSIKTNALAAPSDFIFPNYMNTESKTYKDSFVVSLDGVNDWFTLNNPKTFSTLDSWTFETWIKPTSSGTNYALFGQDSSVMNVWIYQNGQLRFREYDSDYHQLHDGLIMNEWNHVVITYDGAGTMIGYVNAVPGPTLTGIDGQFTFSHIGNGYPGGYYYKGKIDSVRVLNRTLTELEVKKSYGVAKAWESNMDTAAVAKNSDFSQYYLSGDSSWKFIRQRYLPSIEGHLYYWEFYTRTPGTETGGSAITIKNATTDTNYSGDIHPGLTWKKYSGFYNSTGDGDQFIIYDYSDARPVEVKGIKIQPVLNVKEDPKFVEDFSLGGFKYGAETLLNPSVNNNLDNVSFNLSGDTVATHNTSNPIAGTGSVNLTQTEASDNTWQPYTLIYTNVNVQVGEMYLAQFTIRVNSGTCRVYEIEIQHSANRTDINETLNKGQIKTFRVPIYISDTPSFDYVRFILNGKDEPVFDVDIDDFSVKQITNGVHGLASGGFENSRMTSAYSWKLDGVNDYINYEDKLGVGTHDALWFYWLKTKYTGTYNFFASHYPAHTTTGGWDWNIRSTGNLEAILRGVSGSAQSGVQTSGLTLNDGNWHFIAMTRKDSVLNVYVDNVLAGSSSNLTSGTNLTSDENDTIVGARLSGNYYFNGELGDNGMIVFNGNDGKPAAIPDNIENWIHRIHNATEWKYTNE